MVGAGSQEEGEMSGLLKESSAHRLVIDDGLRCHTGC